MKKLTFILTITICCLTALAQTQSEVKHFASDGLSFDYPAGWAMTDRSTPQAQHLVFTLPGSSALLMVIAHRDSVTSLDQLQAARKAITEPFVENVAQKIGTAEKPAQRDAPCTEIGELKGVSGARLRGTIDNQPGTGEVYSLILGRRFVNLVYIRMNRDETQGASAWELVRKSIKIEATQATAVNSSEMMEAVTGGGVLNGRAISLPRPSYPREARASGAGGVVVLQVTINEKGDVISAHAVQGHTLLRAAGESAAARAKFTPTLLCGQPVKVTGVITYNFVAM